MSDWLREGPDSERSPLLFEAVRNSKWVRVFWAIFLTILFGTGIGIGGYLILEEDSDIPAQAPYVLMTRDGWRASPATQAIPEYTNRLTHVALTQTSTENCATLNDCARVIRAIQRDHASAKNLTDIAYNFIVAGDGATYEGRGWKLEPALPNIVSNQTLVVAFLGNFDYGMPPAGQIEECRVLLKHALDKGVLDPCFTLTQFKERPQDGGGQLGHVFNRLVSENNKRRASIKC